MKLFFALILFSFNAQSQLVARILTRSGTGEKINMYEQIPPNNPNGRKHAAIVWLHGQGERGTPGDTSTSNGLPKLKNAGTSPFAALGSTMMVRYILPNSTDSIYYAVFMLQCSTAYGTWPPFYDSAALRYIKATYSDTIDTTRIMMAGHSQGAGGCFGVAADSADATQHNFIAGVSAGYFPSTLTGAGYANAARWMPHARFFHSANDTVANIVNSDNMINGINAAANGTNRGPLCPIQYVRFSGASPGTSGHNITYSTLSFLPTGLSYAQTNGENYNFTIPVYQEALKWTTSPNRRPPNF